MACVPTNAVSELEFVKSLPGRGDEICAGPRLRMAVAADQVWEMDRIFDSELAHEVLWSGFEHDSGVGLEFALCAAHWLDLIALFWVRSLQQGLRESEVQARVLLRDLCFIARWDAKEIVNMLAWQRLRLT